MSWGCERCDLNVNSDYKISAGYGGPNTVKVDNAFLYVIDDGNSQVITLIASDDMYKTKMLNDS